MTLKNLVKRNRSYRKFYANELIPEETLITFIELAQKTPSSKNIQPLKYIPVTKKEETDFVFNQLSWAKHLKNWNGPDPDERPPAYLIMLMDKKLNENALIDAGISAQTILLGATETGLGGCIIRTVDRQAVRNFYTIPEYLEIIQVIALGKPRQEVRLTALKRDGDYHYYQDEHGVHWVPKRSLEELIYKPGT
jgi:nitroreductase